MNGSVLGDTAVGLTESMGCPLVSAVSFPGVAAGRVAKGAVVGWADEVAPEAAIAAASRRGKSGGTTNPYPG